MSTIQERAPKENRFEFVVTAGLRARQLLAGAVPREAGEKKVTIAQREVLRRKVEKIEEAYGRPTRRLYGV
jgi:DNA-directed RNA polymerase subunit K/omega